MKQTRSTCPYCGVGCGLVLRSQDDRVTGVSGDPEHDVSRGELCPKGATAHEFVHHPERLTSPLVRREGRLMPASWEEAYAVIADGFAKVLGREGPGATALISSARATVEENYLAQKFARVVLGTNQLDNCFRICHSATVVGLTQSLGSGAMTNAIRELAEPGPKVILAVGTNTPHSHPIVWSGWMKRAVKAGAKLVIVDPRAPDSTRLSSLHLPIRPGTEILLFNAMAHHILAMGLEDREFLAARCEGLDELKEAVRDTTPGSVARLTNVPAPAIREAAETYARAKPATIVYGLGVTEHVTGVDNVRALANLALLTGNIGKPSSGVNALRGQNNVQGATDMCRPETLPGYQSWRDGSIVRKFEEAWGTRLPVPDPREPWLYCSRMWERILEGELKALYVIGSDPALTEGDSARVERALSRLELLVVQEVFPSVTTRFAHVVLPACSYAEKEGTYVNTERRVQRVRQAIGPVGGSKPDWQILLELSDRMGRPLGPRTPRNVFEEIRRLVPAYAGISYARLDREGGIFWPCPDEAHPGTPTLHEERFPIGRARLAAVSYRPPWEGPDETHPFLLTTGRTFLQYNSDTMTRRTHLARGAPHAFVEISRVDAERLGVAEGDVVLVRTRRGEVRARVRIVPIVPGVAWMPFHFADAPANRLTTGAVDPECGITELKACAASIERTDGGGAQRQAFRPGDADAPGCSPALRPGGA